MSKDIEEIARAMLPKLGRAQRRVIISLDAEWGEAACHQTAKRMFYGVAGQHHPVVFHKHRTDNCWQLSNLGLALKAAIRDAALNNESKPVENGHG